MKLAEHLPANRCLLWHRWNLEKDTGVDKYFICKKCGGRRVISNSNVYQPIDTDWLFEKSNQTCTRRF